MYTTTLPKACASVAGASMRVASSVMLMVVSSFFLLCIYAYASLGRERALLQAMEGSPALQSVHDGMRSDWAKALLVICAGSANRYHLGFNI